MTAYETLGFALLFAASAVTVLFTLISYLATVAALALRAVTA